MKEENNFRKIVKRIWKMIKMSWNKFSKNLKVFLKKKWMILLIPKIWILEILVLEIIFKNNNNN